ncbi:thiamine-phosphate kinase [Verrucomicrobiota bacterium]
MKTLKDTGEFSTIERLRSLLPAGEDKSPGDDCAVVQTTDNTSFDWLLTSDPVIEGIHFDSSTDPLSIGYKAIGRALSDLAAMGGEPYWALINIVAPSETDVSRLEEIYKGATSIAAKFDLAIVGGDISMGKTLELHVFAAGRVPADCAVYRKGAEPGNIIYVTGSLGGSFKRKHLSFQPRVTEGIWLRSESWPTSMIDISDGLASDLRHIISPTETGAELDIAKIPISPEALSMKDNISALNHALCDGEDFELLFTIPASKTELFESSWKDTFDLACTAIGRITDKKDEIEMADKNGKHTILKNKGYEHFISNIA